nr:MAG TPA: hypothetical protein [Caudoviricetes sp.]
MTTIAAIAAEINAQPYELAAFLDMDIDDETELTEDEVGEIWEIINHDRQHNTKPESYED